MERGADPEGTQRGRDSIREIVVSQRDSGGRERGGMREETAGLEQLSKKIAQDQEKCMNVV